MPDRIQRNRTTGEYRVISDTGETRPYTPPTESTGPEMHHPGLTETPFEAKAGEWLRTGKETALGLVRSPWDLLKNTFGLLTTTPNERWNQPSLTGGDLAHAISNPREIPQYLGEHPREGGSLIGQLLLGRYAVPAVAPHVPGAISAVGGRAETLGSTLAETKIGGFGLPGLAAAEAILRSDPMGAAVAATPYALKYGGRGLKRAGAALEGLKRGATEGPIIGPYEGQRAYQSHPVRGFTYEEPAADVPRPQPGIMRGAEQFEHGGEPLTVNRPGPAPSYPSLAEEPPTALQGAAQFEHGGEPRTVERPGAIPSYPRMTESPDDLVAQAGVRAEDLQELRAAMSEPELVEQIPPETQVAPSAADIDTLMQQIPETPGTLPVTQLPTAWKPYLENPVTQGLRQAMEELRQRPTRGLTNPMGR